MLYQHDPRHVDVLCEILGLENGNTVQTPIINEVKDDNPVWLDSEQISKYRSHVARCLSLSHDIADITFAVNELCQRKSDPSQHSFSKLKRLVRYLKGRETVDPSFRTRGHEFRSDSFLGLGLGLETQKLGNRQTLESRSWDDTFRTCIQENRRSSPKAELYVAALGVSEAEGVQSMMCDLGFSVKPVSI